MEEEEEEGEGYNDFLSVQIHPKCLQTVKNMKQSHSSMSPSESCSVQEEEEHCVNGERLVVEEVEEEEEGQ